LDRNAETPYLHATAVVIGEAGVLIRGPSGAGKSSLALSLIAVAQQAGAFSRLIGDDRVGISLRGGRIIARGHPAILGKIERRSQGIVTVPYLPAAVLRAVIQLASAADPAPRYPEPDHDQILLLDARLPLLRICQDSAPASLAPAILADLRLRGIIA
jgi:HPr kinase/phosphorylase